MDSTGDIIIDCYAPSKKEQQKNWVFFSNNKKRLKRWTRPAKSGNELTQNLPVKSLLLRRIHNSSHEENMAMCFVKDEKQEGVIDVEGDEAWIR